MTLFGPPITSGHLHFDSLSESSGSLSVNTVLPCTRVVCEVSRNPERSRRAGSVSIVNITWYTYILLCSDGSFYVGITNDPVERVKKHNCGLGSRYAFSRRPVELAYSEVCGSKSEARKREIQLKGWTHRKKQLLISGSLPKRANGHS